MPRAALGSYEYYSALDSFGRPDRPKTDLDCCFLHSGYGCSEAYSSLLIRLKCWRLQRKSLRYGSTFLQT